VSCNSASVTPNVDTDSLLLWYRGGADDAADGMAASTLDVAMV
jgi:hypothetical protein